ncbi:MAG: Siroheme synthase [Chroococcidiopsis sp. SAG 2025]|uniref:uroporphyrinogen-III C-methyltransferase n=1 Tax=Chroococcidiopsis sp. SAG 2025 TaxID=171389 RepID=UPI002936EABA|nr:uroporphyrinogen-III C-methyltransferase [Chroococcidiopsis sp. SAG 2025]MDV2992793.1 Siroheme synthase [Chroococcidiopsis sp. SAG 2025]
MMNTTGKVYLVGAGPGSIDYLTVRALQLLSQAEVLIYDALVDPQLLELVPSNCLKLDVGKRGGQSSTPQAEIDRLLVEYCQTGQQIIRLKSGDPFIFGRAAAEIEALVTAGCPFEVIPGISSALAAPTLAGIPLTDPVMSHCFAVTTAHEPELVNWEGLASIGTLVFLMGGQQLPEIVKQLVRHGRSPHTPIAIVRWAGTAKQQVWTATLETVVAQTDGLTLSPAAIVVGEVVGWREYLQPDRERGVLAKRDEVRSEERGGYKRAGGAEGAEGAEGAKLRPTPDSRTGGFGNPPLPTPDSRTGGFGNPPLPTPDSPLLGKTVLVTRSLGQSSQFCDRLVEMGATAIEMPALEIGAPSSWMGLDNAIAQLSDFDWLVLTSTNGVDYFFERLSAKGKDTRALAGVKIAVVGQKTAQSLQQRYLQPDFIPPDFVADSLVENFPESLAGTKVLFPRVETGGREVLVKQFTAKGADVVEVAAYESRCPQSIAPEALEGLQSHKVDIITFASSKTVRNFCQLIAPYNNIDLDGVCIASIGPQTSKDCISFLGRVDIEAEEYTLDGLLQAIVGWVSKG